MNDNPIHEILGQIIDVIDLLSRETADLISSGDPDKILHEEPGAASRAGELLHQVQALRDAFQVLAKV